MLGVLLLKDLRRARRNPVPYLIHLAVPLVITALLGLVFGGAGGGKAPGLGRIKLAVVDEDGTPLTRLLVGALNQDRAAEHLEAIVRPRHDALGLVTNSEVAAAFLIPTGFTRAFLLGETPARWELVKNPAQQFHPAIVEEALAAATTGLNALSRNFRPDLDEWRAVLVDRTNVTVRVVGDLLARTGERWEARRARFDPIPVWYADEEQARTESAEGSATPGKGPGPVGNMFAYLLPGLAAMFLLFLADVATRDLHREIRLRTFERFCTFPPSPFVFVLSKVLFTFAILMVGGAILLGGGPVLFQFGWRDPLAVLVLTLGVALFGAGLMSALASLLPGERRADQLNAMVAMILGLASGCTFPAQSLPVFLRDHVTPWLPQFWYIEAVRASQSADAGWPWPTVTARLALIGLVLALFAAWRLRARLAKGVRV